MAEQREMEDTHGKKLHGIYGTRLFNMNIFINGAVTILLMTVGFQLLYDPYQLL